MSAVTDSDDGQSFLFARSDGLTSIGPTERLLELVGAERRLEEVTRSLRTYVQSLRPPVVGALHLTCSDEAEHECIEDFQRNFVRYLLPSRKLSSKAAFASATLGGRYQWGSAAIAEDHFALARGAEKWKLMVLKTNTHVAVSDGPGGQVFGRMLRYNAESEHCGALHAALEGSTLPFVRDLLNDLAIEGVDRVAELNDPSLVNPEHRALFVAIAAARIQARRVLIDLQEHVSASPTLYLVVPCVTLNRRHHDTEMLVGMYACDHRTEAIRSEYTGLGDRPRQYRFSRESGLIVVTDDEVGRVRAARDHRAEVLSAWRETERDGDAWHPKLAEVLQSTRDDSQSSARGPMAKAALGTLVLAALEFAPIPAAVVLFGSGLVRVHHAAAAHRLARAAGEDHVARQMLDGLRGPIDELSPEQAQHLTELLLHEYGRNDKRTDTRSV